MPCWLCKPGMLVVQEELVQIYMDRGLEEDLARRVRHLCTAASLRIISLGLLGHCVDRRLGKVWRGQVRRMTSG